MQGMTAISREKIALVVFVLLVLVGIGSLVAYLSVGHNWNVTASQIDDATGELEGYTAILYAGTAVEEAEDEDSDAASGASSLARGQASVDGSRQGASDVDESASASNASEGTKALSAGSESASESSEAAEGSGAVEAADEATSAASAFAGAAAEPAASAEDSAADSTVSSSASAQAPSRSTTGGGTPLFNAAGTLTEEEKEPVSVEDAAASYRDKQATVFVLDTSDLSKYDEGMILKNGARRFGVFSVAFNEPLPSVQAKVDYLEQHKVDFIVAITPDRAFVEQATDIDIAISLQNEGISFMGETVNGTFYVDTPLVGQVGAILVSPHNVVSAKDIQEL